MEQWCLLKEQLGFSLHSQLAKFLLDRLEARAKALGEGTHAQHPGPFPGPAAGLLLLSTGRFLTLTGLPV